MGFLLTITFKVRNYWPVAWLFVLLSLWLTPAIADNEPLIASKIEKRLGKEFMQEVRHTMPLLKDPIIEDYVQNLGDRLVSATNLKRKKFHFFIVNDPSFNAFAGPGGYIGIYSGTILATNSEDELAAVMAHEIAHVTQHHIERLMEAAKNTQFAAMAGMIAALVVGLTGVTDPSNNNNPNRIYTNSQSADLATGIAMATMGGAVQHLINFTREHEIEADNIGMRILANASFDPHAIPNAFERMQRLNYDYDHKIPKYLLTHPVTSDRIAEAKNRANQYKSKPSSSNPTFSLVQARAMALTTYKSIKTSQDLQNYLSRGKNYLASQYSLALLKLKNHEIDVAAKIADNLQQNHSEEVLFQMLKAETAIANKQSDLALETLKSALSNHSNYYPLTMQYAETLVATKHWQTAKDFLKSKIIKHQNDSNLYWMLAQVYASNNQIADAYQAKAKAYALEEYNRQAIILLQQALKTPKLTALDRDIITAKIEQIKEADKDS